MKGRKILVCDDEKEVTNLLRSILTFNAFEVTAVNDPREVIPTLERGGFDLAILDLIMAGMEGSEILAALRARSDTLRGLPVIILTAKRLKADERTELRRAGASIMEKPFRIEDIVQKVRQSISSQEE